MFEFLQSLVTLKENFQFAVGAIVLGLFIVFFTFMLFTTKSEEEGTFYEKHIKPRIGLVIAIVLMIAIGFVLFYAKKNGMGISKDQQRLNELRNFVQAEYM